MARKDWDYYTLPKRVSPVIERLLAETARHGVKKYLDRQDFVRKAVLALINEEEHKLSRRVEVIQSK